MNKFISRVVVVILLITNTVFADTGFSDDSKIQNYSRPYVEMLVNEGGISGYSDNTFKPLGTISRVEFLSMCVNSFGNTEKLIQKIPLEDYMTVVENYDFDIVWNGAANDLLVSSDNLDLSDKFIGNEWYKPITRAEAAKILCNTLTVLGGEKVSDINTYLINDWNIIKDTEYAESIGLLFALGIVQGDSRGNYNPNSSLTREDSAILICKALKPDLREVRVVEEKCFNTVISGKRGVKSIKNFIKTAFEPVGNVMYIYGGGWNEDDNGAGIEAMTLGLSESWIEFTKKQNSSYNYTDYDYTKNINVIHNGLDCSGYVGWVIYNVLNDGRGYVTNSYKMDDLLAELGYGTITSKENVAEVKVGDIMCSNCNDCRHVYISLGKCSDGSMLLLHASPPGVQLSGTYTPNGIKNSEAIKLATEYMKKYYTEWYNKYPENCRNTSYLTHYDRFEWSILSDDEGYRNMSPEEVLKDIFKD